MFQVLTTLFRSNIYKPCHISPLSIQCPDIIARPLCSRSTNDIPCFHLVWILYLFKYTCKLHLNLHCKKRANAIANVCTSIIKNICKKVIKKSHNLYDMVCFICWMSWNWCAACAALWRFGRSHCCGPPWWRHRAGPSLACTELLPSREKHASVS